MPETHAQFHARMRSIADGKISCPCGNTSWEQFLYIDGGSDRTMAGCKRCGTVFMHGQGDTWTETVRGPARKDGTTTG